MCVYIYIYIYVFHPYHIISKTTPAASRDHLLVTCCIVVVVVALLLLCGDPILPCRRLSHFVPYPHLVGIGPDVRSARDP